MNKRCFIIGGGPSINDMDLTPIKKEFVIGVNESFRLGNWIDIWFFADSDIFKNHRQEIQKWPNRIASCSGAAKNNKKIKYYHRCKQHKICFEPNKLAFPNGMANSGATAINLAIREGFDTIILLGFDMKTVNGKHHYHDYYKKTPRKDAYDRFQLHFKYIAKETDRTILNATPNSALKCFPIVNLQDII